jgi:hypothetical protein
MVLFLERAWVKAVLEDEKLKPNIKGYTLRSLSNWVGQRLDGCRINRDRWLAHIEKLVSEEKNTTTNPRPIT